MDWVKVLADIEEALELRPIDIARATNSSTSYISEIKKGKSKNPKSDFIKALITELHVNPYWLFLGEGDIIAADRVPDLPFDEIQILKETSLYDVVKLVKELRKDKT